MTENTVRVDCHCHVFNFDCVPLKGLWESYLGITVSDPKKDAVLFLRNLWQHYTIHPELLVDSFTNPYEKDNFRYFLVSNHMKDMLAFAGEGMKKIPEILKSMQADSPDISMWVPLMMDMEFAYPDAQPALSFADQKMLMTNLALAGKGRVLPFIAYDPRRSLQLVKQAIEEEGFIGVKLYPPMGFLPVGNNEAALDANLDDLFQYCIDGNLPITAHCSWSDGVFSNRQDDGIGNVKDHYRNMADPAHWEVVLQRYPMLKLNLAHFGGVGEWEARAKDDLASPYCRNWADTIIRLAGDYANVYTDISFHGILARENPQAYRDTLLNKIKGIEDKIITGSDWYMSRIQCDLQECWEGLGNVFDSTMLDKLMGENPATFLRSKASVEYFPRFLEDQGVEVTDVYKRFFNM
jgi:predicted TIM-barrel fold metal-dependent hydrolase